MLTPKISIIVPIYNSEKYLVKCIESLQNQTYTNIEIVLVNDGSKDTSIDICRQYSKNDERIVLIDKENGGVSSARNKGLDIATGDFIGFVDSDDFIAPEMFERMISVAIKNDAEIVECGYSKLDSNYKVISQKPLYEATYEGNYECSKAYLSKTNTTNFNWNKLYRKYLFENLRYSDLSHSEDFVINTKAFFKCNRKVTISGCYYFYVNREGSACNQPFSESRLDGIKAGQAMYEFHEERFPDLCPLISMYILQTIIRRFKQVNTLGKEDKNKYKKILLQNYKKYYLTISEDKNNWKVLSKGTKKKFTFWLFYKSPGIYYTINNMKSAFKKNGSVYDF